MEYCDVAVQVADVAGAVIALAVEKLVASTDVSDLVDTSAVSGGAAVVGNDACIGIVGVGWAEGQDETLLALIEQGEDCTLMVDLACMHNHLASVVNGLPVVGEVVLDSSFGDVHHSGTLDGSL